MLNDLYEMIDELSDSPEEWGRPYFSQEQYYDPVELSKTNFNQLEDKRSGRKICCVDGGNNKIFESPSDSVHLIRIYFNLFEGERRVENIEPVTALLTSKFEGENVRAELRRISGSIPFSRTDFLLKKDELEEKSPVSAGHTVRKYLEWEALRYAVEEYLDPGDIVVRDGVLQTTVESEREFAEEAYSTVEEKGAGLVGIAKTSSLMTTNDYPLIASIQALARETDKDPWYYHPIAENEHPDHKGEMYIVKYHPSSRYAFRTEFYREVDVDVEEVLGELAFQAKDPIFLGYPYGLVEADKKARVTDEEIDYLKNMCDNRMNDSFRDKINACNAHDKLSNI
ncbi:MAG: DNA double-strand break repair nuclease NurA [Candidatus Thermoplasmatota archaeon]